MTKPESNPRKYKEWVKWIADDDSDLSFDQRIDLAFTEGMAAVILAYTCQYVDGMERV